MQENTIELSNHDFGISEIFNTKNTEWFIAFSERFYEEQLKNSELLANKHNLYKQINVSESDFFGRDKFFGELSKKHSFNFPDLRLRFNLSEPIITETLRFEINASQLIGKTFIKALLGETPKEIIWSLSEKRTEEGRRIDLVVEWLDENDKKHLTIIEAKFEHHLVEGQLPAYIKWGEKQISDFKEYIYLTKTGEAPPKKLQTKKDWICISWTSLLRNRENEMSNLSEKYLYKKPKYELQELPFAEMSFHSFRKHIWQKSL